MSSANEPKLSGEPAEQPSEQAIAEYLQAHPDFFERHQTLLTTLRIPHRSGSAVSLVERQVSSLRQSNLQLERKLRDLVDVARNNDELADKVHHLATRLLAAGSRAQAVGVAEELLRSTFSADQSVLVLFENDHVGEFGEVHNEVRRFLRLAERMTRHSVLSRHLSLMLCPGAARFGIVRKPSCLVPMPRKLALRLWCHWAKMLQPECWQ